jgi:hypothetical protein
VDLSSDRLLVMMFSSIPVMPYGTRDPTVVTDNNDLSIYLL